MKNTSSVLTMNMPFPKEKPDNVYSMSKTIYQPKSKAGEYAQWACNLYVGCSNDCSYCYCKRGVLAHAMGNPEPKLKSCFRNEQHAFEVFVKELDANIDAIRRSSLFFTFSSDPLIPETRALNLKCIDYAIQRQVRCQILTKNADFIMDERLRCIITNKSGLHYGKYTAFGFTLTGSDDHEPGASSNKERIAAMHLLHDAGFKTFASLEPVVNPSSTLEVFHNAIECCDLFKVGLMSGVSKDYYKNAEVRRMADTIAETGRPVYFKKSITDYLGWDAMKPIDIFNL